MSSRFSSLKKVSLGWSEENSHGFALNGVSHLLRKQLSGTVKNGQRIQAKLIFINLSTNEIDEPLIQSTEHVKDIEQLGRELILRFFFFSLRSILLLWFEFPPPLVPLFYHLLLHFLSEILPGLIWRNWAECLERNTWQDVPASYKVQS